MWERLVRFYLFFSVRADKPGEFVFSSVSSVCFLHNVFFMSYLSLCLSSRPCLSFFLFFSLLQAYRSSQIICLPPSHSLFISLPLFFFPHLAFTVSFFLSSFSSFFLSFILSVSLHLSLLFSLTLPSPCYPESVSSLLFPSSKISLLSNKPFGFSFDCFYVQESPLSALEADFYQHRYTVYSPAMGYYERVSGSFLHTFTEL